MLSRIELHKPALAYLLLISALFFVLLSSPFLILTSYISAWPPNGLRYLLALVRGLCSGAGFRLGVEKSL
jgi:hypothetical protein